MCTHEGCTVPCPDEDGISRCPCHGAQFDANGDNIRPANGVTRQGNLRHLAVTFEGAGASARIIVHVDQLEPERAARVPPPA